MKLPEEEVDQLVASGTAQPLQWAALLDRALCYVSELSPGPTKRKRRR